jgi:nitroreductase
LFISEEQAVQFLRSRRSIRAFIKDRPVEKETIKKLIEIARYAPTGGNSQMVEWTVFTDKAKMKELSRLMMLGYPKPKYFRLPERKAPKINWK